MATNALLQIQTSEDITPTSLRNDSEVSLTAFRAFINSPGVTGAIIPDGATEIIIESTDLYDWIWDGTASPQWFKMTFKAAAAGFIFTLNAQLRSDMPREQNPDEYTIIGNETIWFHRPVTSTPAANETFMSPYGNTFCGSFAIDTGVSTTDIARKFHFHARVDGGDNLIKMDGWLEFQDRRFVKTV